MSIFCIISYPIHISTIIVLIISYDPINWHNMAMVIAAANASEGAFKE